jgi:hypothetical protein
VCSTLPLPRMPSDVQFVRFVKNFKVKDGGIGTKAFTISRKVVLSALRWLKKYILVYKYVVIAEEKLDWIEDGCEKELPANTIKEDDENDLDNSEMDMGPSRDQIEDLLLTEEYTEEVSGTLRGNILSANLSEHDHTLYDVNEACKQSKMPGMSWAT